MLQELGYRTDTANNGSVAVHKVREDTDRQIAAVLMDCFMPVMDGFEASMRIRELERERGDDRRLAIVACTAQASSDDFRKCLEAGMDDFLAKPIQAHMLRDKLQALIR